MVKVDKKGKAPGIQALCHPTLTNPEQATGPSQLASQVQKLLRAFVTEINSEQKPRSTA